MSIRTKFYLIRVESADNTPHYAHALTCSSFAPSNHTRTMLTEEELLSHGAHQAEVIRALIGFAILITVLSCLTRFVSRNLDFQPDPVVRAVELPVSSHLLHVLRIKSH